MHAHARAKLRSVDLEMTVGMGGLLSLHYAIKHHLDTGQLSAITDSNMHDGTMKCHLVQGLEFYAVVEASHRLV